MRRNQMTGHQKRKLIGLLRRYKDVYVGKASQCLRFLAAVHWLNRTGAQWRELAGRFGLWNSVYKRYARRERLHRDSSQDPDMENLLIDSTVIRAHACAAGAPHKRGGQAAQALAPRFSR